MKVHFAARLLLLLSVPASIGASIPTQHVVAQSINGNSVVTPAADFTIGSPNLIIVSVGAQADPIIMDSCVNVWPAPISIKNAVPFLYVYLLWNPKVCASHTFSIFTSAGLPAALVEAFSNIVALDQMMNSAGGGGAPLAIGSIIPTQNTEVLYSVVTSNNAIPKFTTFTGATWVQIDGTPLVPGIAYGITAADNIQSTAIAENVTWFAPSGVMTAALLSFTTSGPPSPTIGKISWAYAVNLPSTTFSVYRAGGICSPTMTPSKIASGLIGLTYIDAAALPGTYCYYVTATYNGQESMPSTGVNVTIWTPPPGNITAQ